MSKFVFLKSAIQVVLANFLIIIFSNIVQAGTIVGSDHDFSSSGWSGGEICIACHTPHNAATNVTDAPLWNHEITQQTYTLYNSPTLDSSVAQPGGSSKLCLSCHDGSIAIDSLINAPSNGQTLTGKVAVGSDGLNNDHPISMDYTTTLAASDGALHDPAAQSVTIGSGTSTKTGTISEVILFNDKVQCASCHDVHNNFTSGGKLLRVSISGSQLCLTCHAK